MTAWKRVALAMFSVGWGANQFSPLLIAYRDELGMSTQTRAFLFGVYAVGLIPALLIGGAASDRWGRRAVVVPLVALSPLATVLLIVEHESVAGIAVARLLAGICSGVVFSAASAWVSELSSEEAAGTAAKRAAIALSAGFGVGPLVAGLVAELTAYPLTVPYLPHVALGVVALVLLLPVPGPRPTTGATRSLLRVPAVTRTRPFLLLVAPVAPWVFGSAAISIAFLPAEIGGSTRGALAFAGVLTGITLGTGVLVQGTARRLDDRRPLLAGQVGLVAAMVATAIAIAALQTDVRWLLLIAGPVFGAAYGCCLVSGLRETERVADHGELGATVAVFYALTYLGFGAPYALGAVSGAGLGDEGALLLTVGVVALCLAVVSFVGRHVRSTGISRA
ncbi:MFS transporter [Nocardioides psychrotolerans]|uniref:Predicted arabinose efflux permease, MFS family n=1 Tax=Nocardioides psychrotolerans TaxID=1005945 RepID=A0A1I3P1F0_9ACTN|nr:MFS transporter [Nocardioides psychrotolerans]GEP39568.1 MFS transporter [Nocardioides psychrotolerans]SFJ14856.1 Predicted arabinose efflux permease, MFS family [Nocardioides psychrotolerans]